MTDPRQHRRTEANQSTERIGLGDDSTQNRRKKRVDPEDSHSTLPSGGPAGLPVTLPDGVDRLGDYELLEEIARGGMGAVYKARQITLDRLVAVKTIGLGPSPDGGSSGAKDFARFQSEVHAIAQLSHPNIVSIYEAGQADQIHYFAMEYIDGESLAQRIARAPLEPRDAADVALQAATGLQCVHDHGLLHRDLKPANLMLSSDGGVRLTDFGLARPQERASEITHDGQVIGTPSFMAPEQARGNNASRRSDVYAIGAVLHASLTGRAPFLAASVAETLRQVIEQEPPSIHTFRSDVHPDLEAIASKCLEKEPARRYDSAQALADDLTRFLDNRPTVARPVSLPTRCLKWAKRRPAWAGLLSATALTVAAFVITLAMHLRSVEKSNDALKQLAQREAAQRIAAQTAREQAASERDQAQRQTEMALDTMATVVHEIQENVLRQLPAAHDVRKRLLEATIPRLEQISETLRADSEPRLYLADAHLDLADMFLQFDSVFANEPNSASDSAKLALDAAAGVLDGLKRIESANPQPPVAILELQSRHAEAISEWARRANDVAMWRKQQLRAVECRKLLWNQSPIVPHAEALGATLQNAAAMHRVLDDIPRADALLTEAFAIHTQALRRSDFRGTGIHQTDPFEFSESTPTPKTFAGLAFACLGLGISAAERSEFPEAEDWLSHALRWARQGSCVHPDSRSCLEALAAAHGVAGDLQLRQTRLQRCVAHIEAEQKLLARLVLLAPSDKLLRGRRHSNARRLAKVQAKLGKVDDARQQLTLLERQIAEECKRHPDDLELHADWAVTQSVLAEVLLKGDHVGRAIELLESSQATLSAFANATRNGPQDNTAKAINAFRLEDLARVYDLLADAHLKRANPEAAEATAQKGLKLLQRLTPDTASRFRWRHIESRLSRRRVLAAHRQKEFDDALARAEHLVADAASTRDDFPDSLKAVQDYAIACTIQGNMHVARNELPAAVRLYESGWHARVEMQSRRGGPAQDDESIAHAMQLIRLNAELVELQPLRQWVRRFETLVSERSVDMPTNAVLVRQLAEAFAILARVEQQSKNDMEAAELFRRALQSARRAHQLRPDDLETKELLGSLLIQFSKSSLGAGQWKAAGTLASEATHVLKTDTQDAKITIVDLRADALFFSGLASVQQGKSDAGLRSMRQAIDLRKKLVEQDPDNLGYGKLLETVQRTVTAIESNLAAAKKPEAREARLPPKETK